MELIAFLINSERFLFRSGKRKVGRETMRISMQFDCFEIIDRFLKISRERPVINDSGTKAKRHVRISSAFVMTLKGSK